MSFFKKIWGFLNKDITKDNCYLMQLRLRYELGKLKKNYNNKRMNYVEKLIKKLKKFGVDIRKEERDYKYIYAKESEKWPVR